MKKLMFLMLVFMSCIAFAASTGISDHAISIVDEFGQRVISADIVQVQVFISGTETNATIYKEKSKTNAITQPITASSTNTTLSNSVVSWWGDELYDVRIQYKGQTVDKTGLSQANGSVRINTAVNSVASETAIEFNAQPVVVQNDGTAASGVDTEVNVAVVGSEIIEYSNIGTQTALVPVITATGLNIARTQTNDIGTEYNQGITAISKGAYTIGTSPAFYFRVKYTLTDVSGTDDCAIGFRNDGAYAPAIDNYTDMATLNVISGDIYTETIVNNATTVSTDTTNNWADLATHSLQVNVSAAGVVTYLIDGVAPTTVVAYTFDDGDVVVPFFYLLMAADLAETTVIQEWSVGLQ